MVTWVPIPEVLTKRNIPPRSGIPPQASHETLEFQCLDIGIQVYNVLRYMEKGLYGVGHNVVSGEVKVRGCRCDKKRSVDLPYEGLLQHHLKAMLLKRVTTLPCRPSQCFFFSPLLPPPPPSLLSSNATCILRYSCDFCNTDQQRTTLFLALRRNSRLLLLALSVQKDALL
jgi:hypothetical protein